MRYVTGDDGWVQRLLYDELGNCVGVLPKSGRVQMADVVVLCTGANTAALIDAKDEIVARSHCVGVIQLTQEEAERYRDLPIVDDFEQGTPHVNVSSEESKTDDSVIRNFVPTRRE